MKRTITTFQKAKTIGERLAMVTAYDYSMARLADASGVDAILVGDSLGMVCLGYPNTLPVTMADMLHHTKAVARGTKDALLVSDLPFMSYQTSVRDAIVNAGRLIQEGNAEAIKLEGGATVLPQVRAIVKAQIPVMGHLGLTPQSVHVFGGFKYQGKEEKAARQLIEDARRLEDAGAFAIVLECLPAELAEVISKSVSIPVIGIGSGVGCDGQVLVYHDILGLSGDIKPRFAKVFADGAQTAETGLKSFVAAVRQGTFPGPEHSVALDKDLARRLKQSPDAGTHLA
ncbi:MAG: 3-methyl-2-oxobutanoate hydroxymethyltransferase [Eubacteriales bacterium]|nr:3-methyl-2-oxobutanoate hydroxymethyltransferase [Eubacteriales bacterium]